MKTAEKVPLLDFQKALVKVLLEKYNTQKSRHTSNNRPHDAHNPTRLTGRHFPSVFGRKPATNKVIQQRCIVCAKKKVRRETSYTCAECKVSLCVIGCFERYHTIVKF